MENKLEKLTKELATLVEKYSDNESFIYELNVNGINKSIDEMFSIKVCKDTTHAIISVSKYKSCGNYILTVGIDK